MIIFNDFSIEKWDFISKGNDQSASSIISQELIEENMQIDL